MQDDLVPANQSRQLSLRYLQFPWFFSFASRTHSADRSILLRRNKQFLKGILYFRWPFASFKGLTFTAPPGDIGAMFGSSKLHRITCAIQQLHGMQHGMRVHHLPISAEGVPLPACASSWSVLTCSGYARHEACTGFMVRLTSARSTALGATDGSFGRYSRWLV